MNNKKYSQIIFANMAEAMEEITKDIPVGKKKLSKIQEELSLSDRIILWGKDNKILATSTQIPTALLAKNKENLGFINVKNIFTEKTTDLSGAIINNKKLWAEIVKIIEDNPGINLSAYSMTDSFLNLVNRFRKLKLKFNVYEKPSQDEEWLIRYLDSKIGSRTEIDKIKNKDINTPQSIICRDLKEVMSVAEWFYKKNLSCVIKTNFGESGWGTLMIKRTDYASWQKALTKINKEFIKDSIWGGSLFLVEEYILSERGISSGCPSAELFLTDKGFEITYICDQIVTKDGNFLGITLGKNALDGKVKNRITRAANLVGKRFWELGYRGFFDIDFVLSKEDGTPYIIETNMRRTGGTHIFDSVNAIFGEDWEQKCFCISDNQFTYGKNILSVDKILCKLNDILYPINNKKRGIMLTLINKWKPALGFIVIGVNKKDAILLYNKMLNKWSEK
jgi:hypothetical protein